MEIQLQDLIEKIKTDGVTAAENEADEILKNAQIKADKIISDAKAQADKYIADAKEENDRFVKVSEDAIRQAGRNLLISFRESVNKELNAVIGEKISEIYSSDMLSKIIADAVTSIASNYDKDDLSVLINNKDFNEALLSTLKQKTGDGINLTPDDSFNGGFRISVNNGTAYYDFSAEAVTEMLSSYLNPQVTKLMKEAE